MNDTRNRKEKKIDSKFEVRTRVTTNLSNSPVRHIISQQVSQNGLKSGVISPFFLNFKL